MWTLLLTAIVLALTLAAIGYLVDRQKGSRDADHRGTPLQLLPGDIKYESPSGNVRVYFPITTSIILSIVLSLVLRYFS